MSSEWDYTFSSLAPDSIDISAIERELSQLDAKETALLAELERCQSSREEVEEAIFSLSSLSTELSPINQDVTRLEQEIARSHQMLDKVCRKVKTLDFTKGRVFACMKRVDDVIDLRSCSEVVNKSLASGDYERAAAHLHRYLVLDERMIKDTVSGFSDVSTVDASFQSIREAETELKTLMQEKFEKALVDRDEKAVERYFKIFPFLFLHEEGLQKYSQFLRGKISFVTEGRFTDAVSSVSQSTTSKPGIGLAIPIISLFADIQHVVLDKKPTVDVLYGPGYLLYIILALQRECDVWVKRILSQQKQIRKIDLKLAAIHDNKTTGTQTHKKVETKELDVILTELTTIISHAENYFAFIYSQMQASLAELESQQVLSEDFVNQSKMLISECKQQVQELLSHYLEFENHFMRQSIDRASELNQSTASNSLLDDTFYILHKCMRRAISTSSPDCIGAMLNDAGSVLMEFKSRLQSKNKAGSGVDIAGVIQAKLPGAKSADQAHLHTQALYMNQMETCLEYIDKLACELETDLEKFFSSTQELNCVRIRTCLDEFRSHSKVFKIMLNSTISDIYKQFLLPKVHAHMENYSTRNFNISMDEFSQHESSAEIQGLLLSLQEQLNRFNGEMSGKNFGLIIDHLLEDICQQLERGILKSRFTQMGAMLLDKEFRALSSYLSSKTSVSIREKLARMSQIISLLSLESLREVRDYWRPNTGLVSSRLSLGEVKNFLKLRVDLDKDLIMKIY